MILSDKSPYMKCPPPVASSLRNLSIAAGVWPNLNGVTLLITHRAI